MCYKVLHGLVDLESSCIFKRSLYPSTRVYLLKSAKLPIVSERDKNLFSNRAINI